MIEPIADNLWHAVHRFTACGLPVTSRMTIVRLADGSLLLHSPVQYTPALHDRLTALGTVQYLVVPNRTHHLFVSGWVRACPEARLFGPPGLAAKRPDLGAFTALDGAAHAAWSSELDYLLFGGVPLVNETIWFHRSTRTLIVTDLCQCWEGPLPWAARAYAALTGVRSQLAVPRTVRLVVRDRKSARASAQQMLQWPFERVVLGHNCIICDRAHEAIARALAVFRP